MMNKEKMMNKVEHTNSKIQYQLDKLEFHVNKIGIDNVDDDHRLRLIDILKIDEVLTESELTIISPDVSSEETTKSFESEFDWEQEVHIGQHERDCKKCAKYFEDYISESDNEPDSFELESDDDELDAQFEDLEADQIVEDRIKKEPTNKSPISESNFKSKLSGSLLLMRNQEIRNMNKDCEEQYDIEHPEAENHIEGGYGEQDLLVPTDLRQLKKYHRISDADEGKLIVAIYNKDIEAKMQIKRDTRNDKIYDPRTGKYRKNQRFARTKPRKFSSYSAMKRAYKPRSLNALKTRLKSLVFRAMPELNAGSEGVYNASDWCHLIDIYSRDADALVEYSEHGELVDRICDLIKGGNYVQAPRAKRKVKPNFISNQMKSNQMKFEELVADQSRVFRSYFAEHMNKTGTLL